MKPMHVLVGLTDSSNPYENPDRRVLAASYDPKELQKYKEKMEQEDSEFHYSSYEAVTLEPIDRDKVIEQLCVQLAGCSTAALGLGTDSAPKQGDYGWSASYQDVLDLREKYDKLLENKPKCTQEELEALWDLYTACRDCLGELPDNIDWCVENYQKIIRKRRDGK